jgi:hypothetical protein
MGLLRYWQKTALGKTRESPARSDEMLSLSRVRAGDFGLAVVSV